MLKKVGEVIKQLTIACKSSLIASFKLKKKALVLILPFGDRIDFLCISESCYLIASIEKGHLNVIESDQQLVGPLIEKGVKDWLHWLEKKFDLSLIGGGPDQMMIVRGLHLDLVQNFAIHRVLPFKLEQHLPMPLEKMYFGYLIQEHDESGSWATVHICSREHMKEFLSSCHKIFGKELDLFYPQSFLLFQALNEERKEGTFVFLHQIKNYYISFLAHQGRILASKTIKNDQGNIETLIKHLEKSAREIGQDSIPLLLLEPRDDLVLSDFWKVEELNQSIHSYFFLSLLTLQNSSFLSRSVNLLSHVNPDRLNRPNKTWMQTVFAMFFCTSYFVLAGCSFLTSIQRVESIDLYKHLLDKMENHSIEALKKSPSSLQEATKEVLSLIQKGEEQSFESEFFSYPSLERMIGWISLETHPGKNLKEKPLVRIKKISYLIEDRSRPLFSFSFFGKSEKDLELFQKQVTDDALFRHFSKLNWDINELEGNCECLLVNQADDAL